MNDVEIKKWKIKSLIDVVKARKMYKDGTGIEIIAERLNYKDPMYLKQKMDFFGNNKKIKEILLNFKENNPSEIVLNESIEELLEGYF